MGIESRGERRWTPEPYRSFGRPADSPPVRGPVRSPDSAKLFEPTPRQPVRSPDSAKLFERAPRQPVRSPDSAKLFERAPRRAILEPIDLTTKAAETAASKKVIEYTYDPVFDPLAPHEGLPFADPAYDLGFLRKVEHHAVYGAPAEQFSQSLEFCSPISEVVGAVATEFALPLDKQIRDARKALCLVGMLASALTGNVQVFAACLKLYTRDKAVDFLAGKLHEAAFGTPRSAA